MSNTKFTGLKGRNFLKVLKPLISEKLPKLNQALSEGHGKWAVEERRFVFRYAPSGNYRREELMLRLFRREELTKEEELMLTLLGEAQEFRSTLIDESGSSWDDVDSDEVPRKFPGLSLYLQDWWTSQRGKTKRVHSGLEICFVAAEAEEEPEAADAPAASPWGES